MRVVVVTGVGDLLGARAGSLANFVVRRMPARRAAVASAARGAVQSRAGARGAARKAELPKIEPNDLAFLQYTGGTTGVPKGAMLTHRNMIANLQQVAAWIAPVVAADRARPS